MGWVPECNTSSFRWHCFLRSPPGTWVPWGRISNTSFSSGSVFYGRVPLCAPLGGQKVILRLVSGIVFYGRLPVCGALWGGNFILRFLRQRFLRSRPVLRGPWGPKNNTSIFSRSVVDRRAPLCRALGGGKIILRFSPAAFSTVASRYVELLGAKI